MTCEFKNKVIAVMFMLVLCTGCSGPLRTVVIDSAPKKGICRVAIIPFINESRDQAAALMLTRIFESSLIQSGNYTVIPEGEVQRYLTLRRLTPQDFVDPASTWTSDLARQLRIDAFIRGKVIDLGIRRETGGGKLPYISLQIDLVEVPSGALLFRTFNRRSGGDYREILHLGTETTRSGLAARVSEEILQNWGKNGVGQCRS